jgi:hypothetical protein
VTTGQHLPAAPGTPGPPGAPAEAAGIASLAVRDLLHGPQQAGQVLAVVQGTLIVAFPGAPREPRVMAISAPDAVRLPNAIIAGIPAAALAVTVPAGPAATSATGPQKAPKKAARTTTEPQDGAATAGGGWVRIGGTLNVHARRWWDPSPVFGPLSSGRLDQGAAVLSRVCRQGAPGPALADHEAVRTLAACCAAGDLAGSVEQAERLVGLGAGIVPPGDSVLCGLLLALRLLGGAITGGSRAVWLADWLSAAVTSYASERTTPLAASLLHCAARGQASAEAAAVLHGLAGEDPEEPAARRLLTVNAAAALGTADLAWGMVAGCRAAQSLSVS